MAMITQLRPAQLGALLRHAFAARLPVLIQSAPGLGKSSIVEQAAAAAEHDLIVSHPVVEDPTDAKGLPWIVDGAARFLPVGQIARALDATRPTVWLLDDLGQAAPAVQAAYMQLLLAREVAGHKLPDCVTFVAATNRRTDRAGVGGILEPVKSRFGAIVELTTNVDDWSQWALRSGIAPALIAFLRFRPELLHDFQPSADLTQSPSPRTWAFASQWIHATTLPDAVRAAAIAGAVGETAATEFLAFERMYQQLPSIDAILADPDAAPIPAEISALYATVTALATRANAQTFGRIARYAERLTAAARGDMGALLIRDCVRRSPDVQQTPGFVHLVSGELGALIHGGNR